MGKIGDAVIGGLLAIPKRVVPKKMLGRGSR